MVDYVGLKAIGSILIARRQEAGVSRAQVAKRVGMHSSYLLRVENGKQHGSTKLIAGYERALGLAPGSVLAEAAGLKVSTGGPQSSDLTSARLYVVISPEFDGTADITIRIEAVALKDCDGFAIGTLGAAFAQGTVQSIRPSTGFVVERFIDPVQALVMAIDERLQVGHSMNWTITWNTPPTNRLLIFPMERHHIASLQIEFEGSGCHPPDVWRMTPIEATLESYVSHLPYGTVETASPDDTLVDYPYEVEDLVIGDVYGIQWDWITNR